MFSPANFLASNPVALKKAVETNGRSLVEGLENLVKDLERNGGDLLVTLSDPDAFKVGETLATTKGHVVYETPLFQLIRYEPVTEKVFARPLLLIPPWINKFYILDLQPKSSLVKWLTEQGIAVYIVSWKNPREELRAYGMESYVTEGIVPAPEANHAVKGAIVEALRCKAEGKAETILFNLCGHGHFDMAAYTSYFAGKLTDQTYDEAELATEDGAPGQEGTR
jgi:polyhydroxyalkanoate synthase